MTTIAENGGPEMTEQRAAWTAAYIDSLPPKPSRVSAPGSPERGRAGYAACAACHGPNAEGRPDLGAPALRQQSEAYLRIQLEHFASGIRGADPADSAGQQMRAAARSLLDARSTEDVIAFIGSR